MVTATLSDFSPIYVIADIFWCIFQIWRPFFDGLINMKKNKQETEWAVIIQVIKFNNFFTFTKNE